MDPGTIDGFEIEREIGRGGMGHVYAATRSDGARAAIKVLARPESADLVQRFEREAGVRIRHENVVEVLAHGVSSTGHPYIAFELLEGETLLDHISRRPLTPEEAVEIGMKVCHGLAA